MFLLGNFCLAIFVTCSFAFLFVPWYFLEQPGMEVSQIKFNFWIFFSNAICALALNFSIFLVIGRTGAVTIRVAGVLKDWILIALSTVIFPESIITGLNITGYAIGILSNSSLKLIAALPPSNPLKLLTLFFDYDVLQHYVVLFFITTLKSRRFVHLSFQLKVFQKEWHRSVFAITSCYFWTCIFMVYHPLFVFYICVYWHTHSSDQWAVKRILNKKL